MGFLQSGLNPCCAGKNRKGFCGRGRGREWVAIHRERQELPEGVGGDALIEVSFVGGAGPVRARLQQWDPGRHQRAAPTQLRASLW